MAVSYEQVQAVLLGNEEREVRRRFVDRYGDQLDVFVQYMTIAFEESKKLDYELSKDEQGAYVAALFYGALQSHTVAMKLLIGGLLVPSGNTQRYALESFAMALLFSKPSLGLSEQYRVGKYSPNKAVRDVVRNFRALGLERESLKTLERSEKFYHKFSHPSRLSLSQLMILSDDPPGHILGGSYDAAKEHAYDSEIVSRIGLASIFPNIAYGIRRNYLNDV